MRTLPAALLLAVGMAVGLAGPATAQADHARRPLRFGTGVDMIRLNVSVTEGGARYVTGLSQADFAVFEDGQPQQVSYFARDPLPMSLSLLIDCSASMEEKLPTAQVAAARFIQTLSERDLGQVIQFNDRATILQDYTGDRAALERAVRSTRASGPTALFTALYVALKGLVALEEGPGPRRQAVVLLSDGEDTASSVTEDQVLALAREANTVIYAIGLQSGRPLQQQRASAGRATHFLTTIARESGGQVYLPRVLSELDSVYGQIVEDLRTQYTIGYVSANARRDGRWRRIVVRTPSRGSLQLRYRIGYQAPKG
jgi:Ca-activated chloride channel family protein